MYIWQTFDYFKLLSGLCSIMHCSCSFPNMHNNMVANKNSIQPFFKKKTTVIHMIFLCFLNTGSFCSIQLIFLKGILNSPTSSSIFF